MNCPHRRASQMTFISGSADDRCPTCLMVDELIEQLVQKQMREDPRQPGPYTWRRNSEPDKRYPIGTAFRSASRR